MLQAQLLSSRAVGVEPLRNLRLTLQYDGTAYAGWQIQPRQPTIQGALTEVLSRIEGRPVQLHGAGRTDAGVHALGQVANYMSAKTITCDQLKRALNASIARDIRVIDVEEVEEGFHARFSAKQKTYRYVVALGETVSPFEYRYVYHYPYSLDIDALRLAASAMIGRHDFAAFATATDIESTTRTVTAIEIFYQPDRLVIEVTGEGFLRYMVRTMVGTLLWVGRGRLAPDGVSEILASRNRSLAGETAPASGLTLVRIDYENPPLRRSS